MDNKEDIFKNYQLKYTILRRAIQGKIIGHPTAGASNFFSYSTEDLKKLSYEIEGKNLEELKEIHKKWIGYW